MFPACFHIAFLVVTLLSQVAPQAANLTGCKVVSVTPNTEDDQRLIHNLLYSQHIPGTELWSHPSPIMTDTVLQVCNKAEETLNALLNNTGMKLTVNIEDLQTAIDEQMAELEIQGRYDKSSGFSAFGLGQYHNLDEIYDFLDVAAKEHPDKMATASIGKTDKGRNIVVAKIGQKSSFSKPAIFINSGIHAREWISIATSIYIMHQLVSSNDSATEQVLRVYDWYFLPVANPDGYAYSWSRGDVARVPVQEYFHPRLWRKNRSNSAKSICVGVDVNRNFDIDFHGRKSSSSLPCSQVYRGQDPFSEKESYLLSNYLTALKNNLKAFVDIHSFGQMWMMPYGYKADKPKDYTDMLEVATLAAEALEGVHGTKYRVGTIEDTVYGASGSGVDWAYEVAGIKYSYGVEVRDKGKRGFLLPQEDIVPTAKEIHVALIKMATEIANRELNNLGPQDV